MDINLSAIGGMAGSISLLIILADKIYYLVNHRRVRSKCCGRNMDMSIDIDQTTPNITPPQERALI